MARVVENTYTVLERKANSIAFHVWFGLDKKNIHTSSDFDSITFSCCVDFLIFEVKGLFSNRFLLRMACKGNAIDQQGIFNIQPSSLHSADKQKEPYINTFPT